MMFSTGLIGELVIRTYFETQNRRIYAVREILTQKRRERVDERRRNNLPRRFRGWRPSQSGARRSRAPLRQFRPRVRIA